AGEFAAARGELERALLLDPSRSAAARLLARVLLRAGEPDRGLDWLDHAAIDGAESHGVALLRASFLDALGRRDDAHRVLDAGLASALRAPLGWRCGPKPERPGGVAHERRLDPAHAFHADRRCELAMRLLAPRPAEAVEHLEAALSLNPRFLRAHVALALL